ncbi:MAG: hypothetical protein F7O42_06920 [Opitutae bacterium]|nr:hypothetical protein [Opitutae bacterium]
MQFRFIEQILDTYEVSELCEAFKAAVMTRGDIPPDIVHHSDRGSTCFSMRPSMSGKGNCYGNTAMESFYGRYKRIGQSL